MSERTNSGAIARAEAYETAHSLTDTIHVQGTVAFSGASYSSPIGYGTASIAPSGNVAATSGSTAYKFPGNSQALITISGVSGPEAIGPITGSVGSYTYATAAPATPLDTHLLTVATYTLNYALGNSASYNVVFDAATGTTSQLMVIPSGVTVTVSDGGGTYNGSAFPATSAVTGANGLSTTASSLDYYDTSTSTDLGTVAPAPPGTTRSRRATRATRTTPAAPAAR